MCLSHKNTGTWIKRWNIPELLVSVRGGGFVSNVLSPSSDKTCDSRCWQEYAWTKSEVTDWKFYLLFILNLEVHLVSPARAHVCVCVCQCNIKTTCDLFVCFSHTFIIVSLWGLLLTCPDLDINPLPKLLVLSVKHLLNLWGTSKIPSLHKSTSLCTK